MRLDPIGCAALLVCAALAFVRPAAAQGPSEVTVNVFPGGFNWGIYVAQERGIFAKNGINVTVQGTGGSVAQMTGLSEGKFDIAMTAVDNIVAYVEGQGEAPIGPQPEFFAFMGSDTGFLSLVTAPDVKTVADLKGRALSVDALTTGYAFVLFDILRRSGLGEGDYQVAKVGGMVQRWNALREHKQDGTMLSTPYNILIISWRRPRASPSSRRRPGSSAITRATSPRRGAPGPPPTRTRWSPISAPI
jgi:ABC-type nitrate/sulfonate/bicarbonate transport system substrate-binding protein